MFQREKLFDYFSYYELEFLIKLSGPSQDPPSSESKSTQIRLFYAMMYYAFEIKNNMHASIAYYQKLKHYTDDFPQLRMPWVSHFFSIDESKVSDYGGVKINKAQIVKANDEELMQLKHAELKENEEAKKTQQIRGPLAKVKPQFVCFSGFYLD
jgi:hypothetical protein